MLDDLLLDLGSLRVAASHEAAAGRWLDAYLLTCGALQVIDDWLHRSDGLLDRAVGVLPARPYALRWAAVSAAQLRDLAARRSRSRRVLSEHRDELLDLTVALAGAALDPSKLGTDALRHRVEQMFAEGTTWPPDADAQIISLPACFRSFDQHPADAVALARLVEPELTPNTPVVVAGVRTSGIYLGALIAADLRAQGRHVEMIGIRPGDRLDAGQRRPLAGAAGSPTVLVVDDPPVSGSSIAGVVGVLESAGMDADQIVVVLAVDADEGGLPALLAGRRNVVLPGRDWHTDGLFEVDAARSAIGGMLGPRHVLESFGRAADPRTGRETTVGARRVHRRAAFAATVVDEVTGHREDRLFLVEGVGLGWFGRHASRVAERLPGLVPDVLGLADGLLYQSLPAGTRRWMTVDDGGTAMERYFVSRHRAMPVASDRSFAIRGRRQAVWEVAAEVVGRGLGRLDLLIRVPLVYPVVRSLLAVSAPSVVDGRVALDRWLDAPGSGPLKSEAAEGSFTNRELATYDPVFDLAGLAGIDTSLAERVRNGWETATGTSVDPERWVLHRLVHAWSRRRNGGSEHAQARAVAQALQGYVAEVLLPAERPPADGPWCALDVDGVLETAALGSSAPSAEGGLALASLIAHRYRVVLVTGRSVDDVADRVVAWGLPGGVAEYGCALVADGGTVTDLRSSAAREVMAQVATSLRAVQGVELDLGYRYAVRAYRRVSNGGRRPLDPDETAVLLALRAGRVEVVVGEDQTDFVPVGYTKATGVRELLARLDPGTASDRPLALAVGDGPADVPLIGLAQRFVAPRHADPVLVTAGATKARGAYQAGLADAVGMLIGHRCGGCPTCRQPLSDRARLLLPLFSLYEAGAVGAPRRLGAIVVSAARAAVAG